MKNFWSKIIIGFIVFLLGMGGTSFSLVFAGEVDILMRKLVEKGVLSQNEATEILAETKAEAKAEIVCDTGKSDAIEIPAWVRNIQFKGDLRVRYQFEDITGSPDRHRGRYRLRLGVEGKVNDQMKVCAGLATGLANPRSTNQEFTDNFATPDIRLDYAYGQYDPFDWATVKVGKIEAVSKTMFIASDLLWDSDINPEGVSLLLNKKNFADNLDLFLNASVWVVDESLADTSDPFMYVVQPGFKYTFDLFDKEMDLQAAAAYYGFENVKGSVLDYTAGSNTLVNGVLKYNYNSFSPSIKLGVKDPFSVECIPYLALYTDYVYNPDSDDCGYLAGLTLGDKSIKGWADWQVSYMYRYLERDCWPDAFPDADTYGGRTDVKAHEIIFNYGLNKNTWLGLDYYYNQRIEDDGENHVLQADWNFKF